MVEQRKRLLGHIQAISGSAVVGLVALIASLAQPCPAYGAATQDAQRLAAEIDRMLAARWSGGVVPAPLTDDAEFLRRVFLDLAGHIPLITEARDFLDDDASDKRQRLVERLLTEPSYSGHFANLWRALLLPGQSDQQGFFDRGGMEAWLRERFQQNAGYDRMVREILTGGGVGGKSPVAFLQVNQGQPETLASNSARLFLGIKLECAQCHNHPHAQWTRQQFWELAAFFSNGAPQSNANVAIQIPGTDKKVKARFPDGTTPQWKSQTDARKMLAEWMTSPTNPYFARTAVNRLWGYFFGIGLVEPVDDSGPHNPASHVELLDMLAQQFVAHQFDLRFLIRALTSTQAYQRSSKATDPSQLEPRLFACMAVRGLTPEQLFDSLVIATEYPKEVPPSNRGFFNNNNGDGRSARAEFLARFKLQEKRTEVQTSILQALHLMNGSFMADATSLERSRVLISVAEAARSDNAKRIEELYLNTLGRKPRAEESARLVKYLDSGGASGSSKKALADVFWALLNSSEFMLNH